MSFERIHRARSQSPQTSSSTSQFAPRPFPVQEPKRPPTQEDIENEAFQQNKFETFGLQLKEKSGTITPVEQERLGVLQAKMDSFWAQRMERAKAQPNLLEILIRNSQAIQTTESQAPVQSNTIQAKSDTTGDSLDLSVEQHSNKTGMPDALKAGVENLSGYSLDDVRVHYNSPQPAQLQALAYTKGTEIHVAPGQEEHLPHEAWHIVQQMQGRVQPTMQSKGISLNDDIALECEADAMGAKALHNHHNHRFTQQQIPMQKKENKTIQLYPKLVSEDMSLCIDTEIPGFTLVKHEELGWNVYRTLDGQLTLYSDDGRYYTDSDCSVQAFIGPYVHGTRNAGGASYSYDPDKLTGMVMDLSEVLEKATNLRDDIDDIGPRVMAIIQDEATGHPTRPIEVRLAAHNEDFSVIQGNHRIKASQILNKSKIPVNFV